jgi:hypothetical protein
MFDTIKAAIAKGSFVSICMTEKQYNGGQMFEQQSKIEIIDCCCGSKYLIINSRYDHSTIPTIEHFQMTMIY